MGDVAMVVPLLRIFVSQNQEVKVTVVSKPFFKPFFEEIKNVSFFAVDVKNRHKGFLGLLQLFWDLKKLKIDAVADLHNVLRSKIIRNLFALYGKKIAFTDKGRTEKKALTRSKNKIFKPLKSMFERHANTFEQLGFRVDLSNPKFPENAVLSKEILNITGPKETLKWIGIAPFAQYQSKIYPLDLMQMVIDALVQNENYKIFLFGGTNEIETLNRLGKNHENVVVIAGTLSFKEEMHLISNLDVMLSMDSGNAHLAALFGIRTITLWGATHPFAGFSPFNQPIANALVSDRHQYPLLPTSVYGNKKVVGYEDAMRTILVDDVVAKIEKDLHQ